MLANSSHAEHDHNIYPLPCTGYEDPAGRSYDLYQPRHHFDYAFTIHHKFRFQGRIAVIHPSTDHAVRDSIRDDHDDIDYSNDHL